MRGQGDEATWFTRFRQWDGPSRPSKRLTLLLCGRFGILFGEGGR